jgi:hypothetical protein
MPARRPASPEVPPRVAALSSALGLTFEVLPTGLVDSMHANGPACSVNARGQITALMIRNSRLRDLGPLAELAHLQVLDLERNKIVDLSPLAGLSKLKEITLFKNQISDPSPLEKLTRLTSINLAANKIADVREAARLALLPKMKELVLGYNPLKGCSPRIKGFMNSGSEDAAILAYLRTVARAPA